MRTKPILHLLPPGAPVLGLGLALCVGVAVPLRGEPAGAPGSVAGIAECMRDNLPRDSSVQELRFVSEDRSGHRREILAELKWKRIGEGQARALVRVSAPDDLRGSAVLVIQNDGGADLFMYAPELRKVRRISTHTLSGQLFGSDFTYEDFLILQGMALAGDTQRLDDAEVDGVPVYVLAQHPAPEAGSAYERVVSYVARGDCTLVQAEMWEPGERLRKVLTADREVLFEEDGVRLPRRLRLEDRKKESATVLELITIDLSQRIKRAELSPTALER